ncbi:hypothetical protein B4113_0786 [Geobacillus sp. B4113_201601]|nr:hypothetical protein B4113_0786 [Geobacillus sp. B4113_201601]
MKTRDLASSVCFEKPRSAYAAKKPVMNEADGFQRLQK